MTVDPGTLISANLRLVRKLGQGGMGSVWIAEHLALHTQVAVKLISPEFSMHEGAVERFSREASTAAQLKHPHAVQILDHGVSDQGCPYIVMELLEGEDLGNRISRLGRLGMEETSHILGQTSRALSKAHSLGLVHRDVKPDNIFLTEVDGEVFVKVLDFGIARQINAGPTATATGAMLGTPYYMSPEQLLDAKRVDERADLWSLAVVAYECVTGKVPFDAATIPGVFVAISGGKFKPPTEVVPELPEALDAWFSRALARDPADRFTSARELADSFEAIARNPGHAPRRPAAVPAARAPELALTLAAPPVNALTAPATLEGTSVSNEQRPAKRTTVLLAAVAVIAVLGTGAGLIARLTPAGGSSTPTQGISAVPEPVASLPAASASSIAAITQDAAVQVSPEAGAAPKTPVVKEPARKKETAVPPAATKPASTPPATTLPGLGL